MFFAFCLQKRHILRKPKVKQSVSMPIPIQITLAQSVLHKFYRKRHFKVFGRLFTYIVSLGKIPVLPVFSTILSLKGLTFFSDLCFSPVVSQTKVAHSVLMPISSKTTVAQSVLDNFYLKKPIKVACILLTTHTNLGKFTVARPFLAQPNLGKFTVPHSVFHNFPSLKNGPNF